MLNACNWKKDMKWIQTYYETQLHNHTNLTVSKPFSEECIHSQGRLLLSNNLATFVKKEFTQKEKNLHPVNKKFFPFRLDPISEGVLCTGWQTLKKSKKFKSSPFIKMEQNLLTASIPLNFCEKLSLAVSWLWLIELRFNIPVIYILVISRIYLQIFGAFNYTVVKDS